MSNLFRFIVCLVIILFYQSCKIKDVTYKRIENLNFELRNAVPNINFDIVCYNPNAMGCRIGQLHCEILSNTDSVAYAYNIETLKVRPYSEFSVPVKSIVSAKAAFKLTGKSLLSTKDIPIRLVGHMKIKKFIFSHTYYFDVTESFNKSQLYK
ncbi:MAG: LEA type 2 family protein [Bacteroidia bacterium]|nr:LEA type 2 family protein [Bacteroidia bacterium]